MNLGIITKPPRMHSKRSIIGRHGQAETNARCDNLWVGFAAHEGYLLVAGRGDAEVGVAPPLAAELVREAPAVPTPDGNIGRGSMFVAAAPRLKDHKVGLAVAAQVRKSRLADGEINGRGAPDAAKGLRAPCVQEKVAAPLFVRFLDEERPVGAVSAVLPKHDIKLDAAVVVRVGEESMGDQPRAGASPNGTTVAIKHRPAGDDSDGFVHAVAVKVSAGRRARRGGIRGL